MSSFVDPKKVLHTAGIQPGWTIVDFGAGSGHYVLEAARSLATTGLVIAVDIQQDVLNRLLKTAREEHLSNVEIAWGDIEKTVDALAAATANLVILSNILFQVHDRKAVLREAARVLKPGGKILVVDWKPEAPISNTLRRIPEEAMLELLESAGFSKERAVDAGDYHYGFVCKKL